MLTSQGTAVDSLVMNGLRFFPAHTAAMTADAA